MRLKAILYASLLSFLAVTAMPAAAQFDNTLNLFTPYTLYGVGNLNTGGTAAAGTMAGVGAAMRSATSFNAVNPASYSAASAQTFIFSFGMQGQNDYLKSKNYRSSHNAFNINDVSVQFRIADKLGFGLSVTPYSTVGYKVSFTDMSSIMAESGTVRYSYSGSGGFNRLKAGLGWSPFKNFSVGVDMLYYLGNIKRISESSVSDIVSSSTEYRTVRTTDRRRINTVNFEVGAQYEYPLRGGRAFTVGVVYEPKRKADLDHTRQIISEGASASDIVLDLSDKVGFDMPHRLVAGIGYRTDRLTFGFDYDYQRWKGVLDSEKMSGGGLFEATDMHNVRAGFEYTPNRYDIRQVMKRWTYRGGVRYGNTYYTMNGKKITECAMSVGFGAPLQRNSFTAVNLGAEVGRTGTLSRGLSRDTFVRIYLGFNIFVTQEWFIRHRFK